MYLKFKNNFLGYFKFYYSILRYRIFINLFLSVTIGFIDGMGLAMFMPLLQAASTGGTADGANLGALRHFTDFLKMMGIPLTVTNVLYVLVALFLFKGGLKYVQLIYQVNNRFLFISTARHQLVRKLHNLSFGKFLKLDAGRIQNTFSAEVQRLFMGMNQYFSAGQSLVLLMTYIFLAILANYQFAILVAAGAGLTNLVYRRIYVAVKRISASISMNGNVFNSYLIQAVNNFKYLKATNYFEQFSHKLKTTVDKIEKLNKSAGKYNAITMSMREPLIIIIVVAVIHVQLRFFGSDLSSILLSLLLFYRALTYLLVIQNNWQTFINLSGSMEQVANLLNEMEDGKETFSNVPYPGLLKEIKLNNVSFGYPDITILKELNISLHKNQTIALVGESGSGKTTLANLIAGLLPPTEGEILVNGKNVYDFNLKDYRRTIGFITQEPVIFNDDIFNNITFWDEPTSANMEKFKHAVQLAALENFLNDLPLKEKTPLGDNGVLISGGQKQRISIARELYKQAEILIMDEATSALDSETERSIQENIDNLKGKYTIIIIAHRLSTIKNADKIYLLEKGKLDAEGSFEEMASSSPRFKRMVELQEF